MGGQYGVALMGAAPRTPMIWALDLAAVTGFAVGYAGEKPVAHSIRIAPVGASADDLFAGCHEWFARLLQRKQPFPDVLAIEQLLPPNARAGTTNTGAQHRLAGMHGIVRALARHALIPEVLMCDVGDIRAHFISARNCKRVEAKRRVAQMCKTLGWHADDDNCSDALALWSYAAGLINPVSALAVTPLFGRQQTWEDIARTRESKQRG
jgi:hypothetical protein